MIRVCVSTHLDPFTVEISEADDWDVKDGTLVLYDAEREMVGQFAQWAYVLKPMQVSS